MANSAVGNRAWSDLAIPPGELLAEELDARGMSQREFAERTGRPEQKISEIINAKKAITQDTALEFEKVLGISADFWLGMESTYRLVLAKQREATELEKQIDWLDQFPVAELEHRGLLSGQTKVEKLLALLKFFGVASFPALRQRQDAILGYRVTPGAKVKEGSLWAWLRLGELEGASVETEPFDEKLFRSVLVQVRALTGEPPAVFLPKTRELCASAGVAFTVVKELSGSGANGVARWLSPEKAMIQLSTRYRWVDVFWFSFFHEAAHVLERQKRRVFVNGVNDDPGAEADADRFASDVICPPEDWAAFRSRNARSTQAVMRFADEIGVAPACIVGRMQHEALIPRSHLNALRPRLTWS